MPHIKLEHDITNNNNLNKILRNRTVFVGAFSKTCYHCVNMQPEWNKFISMVNKYKIRATILDIDSNILSSIKNPLINNNIQGFPSLFIIKNNKFVASYNDERSANKFLKFLNKYISTAPKKQTRNLRIKRDKNSKAFTYKKGYKY